MKPDTYYWARFVGTHFKLDWNIVLTNNNATYVLPFGLEDHDRFWQEAERYEFGPEILRPELPE